MAIVWIPAQLRSLTNGLKTVSAAGATVYEVIETLEQIYPGMKARLCDGDRLRSGLALVIDDRVSRQSLASPVSANSEVHFVPAIGGG